MTIPLPLIVNAGSGGLDTSGHLNVTASWDNATILNETYSDVSLCKGLNESDFFKAVKISVGTTLEDAVECKIPPRPITPGDAPFLVVNASCQPPGQTYMEVKAFVETESKRYMGIGPILFNGGVQIKL